MKYFIWLMLVCVTGTLMAQTSDNDIVFLKDGSVIKGKIIKSVADSIITIETQTGNLLQFKNKEVEKTFLAKRTATEKKNNLWLGFNIEPQFQNIFKSQKDYLAFIIQNPGSGYTMPGSGGFQTGFMLNYLTDGIAGFETGLQYHYYQSFKIFSQPFYSGTELISYRNRFQNIEIPVYINVHSNGNKIRFYSSDGISAGVTLTTEHKLMASAPGYNNFDSLFNTPANSTTFIYCTLMVSAGMQVSLSRNTLLNLTGAFRLSSNGPLGATNPFFVPNAYPFFPYSLGINAEILFKAPGKKVRNADFFIEKQQTGVDRARAKHQLWSDAFIVLINGDTVKGKVMKDENINGDDVFFIKDKIQFAHTDETEEKISVQQLKELYLLQDRKGYRKFITVPDKQKDGNRTVYRVAVDGKCQLLSDKLVPLDPDAIADKPDKYYLLYKDKLSPVNIKAADFVNKCRGYFTDCPSLIQQIESKGGPPANLSEMVRQFNTCIAGN